MEHARRKKKKKRWKRLLTYGPVFPLIELDTQVFQLERHGMRCLVQMDQGFEFLLFLDQTLCGGGGPR
jgi:hypothetical protein